MKNSKIRVAFILPSLPNTGPVIAVRDIVHVLREVAECDIYYFDEVEDKLEMNTTTIRISFFKKIDVSKYDILHSHMLRPDLYLYLHYRALNFYANKKTCISSCHDVLFEDLCFIHGKYIAGIVTPIWKFALRKFDKVVVASRALARSNKFRNFSVIGYIRPKLSSFTVPNEDIIRISEFKKNTITIGYVAGMIKRKNHSQILSFLQSNNEFSAIFLGSGQEYENLNAEAIHRGIEDRVLFLGFKQDSRPYYRFFDIYCSPSRSEGFPLSLIDAFSNEVPVVLSKLEIYSDTLKESDVSFFNLNDEQDFSNAIFRCLTNRQKFISNALIVYQNNFCEEKVTDQYVKLYSNLINSEYALY